MGKAALRTPRACCSRLSAIWQDFGGERGWSRAYRASSQFVGLAVITLVVNSLAVAEHSHNIREHSARSVVLVRVEEDTQTLEFILHAKDVALLSPVLGHPHGEAIAEEVAVPVDAELELNLPVRGGQGYS